MQENHLLHKSQLVEAMSMWYGQIKQPEMETYTLEQVQIMGPRLVPS